MHAILLLIAQDLTIGDGAARLQAQKVDVEVQHRVAVTRLTQIFDNPTSRVAEGVYAFAVPPDSAIMDFTMWVGDTQRKATIHDRDSAARVYNTIVNQQRDPGIVEEIADRVFRVRVFPIAGNARCKFELTYITTLPYEDGTVTYTLPLRIPGDRAKDLDVFSFDFRALAGAKIEKLASPSHKLNIARKSDTEIHASFDKSGELDKDVVISYTLAGEQADFVFLPHRRDGEDGHFLLLVTPNALKVRALPKEVVYLIDASSSIDAKTFAKVKKAVLESISRLNEGDTYRIVAFNQKVLDVAEFEKLEPAGRTDFEEAIATVLAEPASKPRLVLVISDGEPSAGSLSSRDLLARTVEKLDKNTVFFGVRIGPETPERILETLATATGGECVSGEVSEAIARMTRRFSIPVMTDVTVEIADAFAVHRSKLRILFASDQPMIAGRYRKTGAQEITLTGNAGGKEIRVTKNVEFPAKAEGWGCAAYLWAEREVRSRLAAIAIQGETSAAKADLIELAKCYRLVTPYTALLVLENDQMYAQFGLERIVEEERRLFKARPKKKKKELGSGGVDLPSATPGVKPVDPLTEANVDRSILASLKWLASARPQWKGAEAGIPLNEVGAYALSFLAFSGAADYEVPQAEMARFEAAVREAIVEIGKRQDARSGLIGTNALNHAIATWALAKLYALKGDPRVGEMAQKGVAYLCDHLPSDFTTSAFMILALSEARLAKLEIEEAYFSDKLLVESPKTAVQDALYVLARAALGPVEKDEKVKAAAGRIAAKSASMAKFDPLLGWLGTEALLSWRGPRSREWQTWERGLEQAIRNEGKRVETNGSWLPAKWAEEARGVATALRVLVEEARDRAEW